MKPKFGFIVFIFISGYSFCQTNKDWKDKLFVGGTGGLNFGDVTFINISPSIGYLIQPKIQVGVNGMLQYINYKSSNFSSLVYGAGIYGRYLINEDLFIHGEYENIYADWENLGFNYAITNIFIGGGYSTRITNKTSIIAMMLYNLNYSDLSPYPNPLIRVGINTRF